MISTSLKDKYTEYLPSKFCAKQENDLETESMYWGLLYLYTKASKGFLVESKMNEFLVIHRIVTILRKVGKLYWELTTDIVDFSSYKLRLKRDT